MATLLDIANSSGEYRLLPAARLIIAYGSTKALALETHGAEPQEPVACWGTEFETHSGLVWGERAARGAAAAATYQMDYLGQRCGWSGQTGSVALGH